VFVSLLALAISSHVLLVYDILMPSKFIILGLCSLFSVIFPLEKSISLAQIIVDSYQHF
jgi:hypothetical protein